MNENIGILSTPDNTGPSISITNNLKVESTSGIRYDEGISINNGSIFLNDNCIWVGNDNYNYLAAVPKLDGAMTISGGTNRSTGGTICLYGINNQSRPGEVIFNIPNSELDNGYNIIRITDTEIRHNSKPIDSIYSFGDKYIQYTNGLLIQWGIAKCDTNGYKKITFLKAYEYNPVVSCTVLDSNTSTNSIGFDKAYSLRTFVDTTTLYVASVIHNLNSYKEHATDFRYLAIGRWK